MAASNRSVSLIQAAGPPCPFSDIRSSCGCVLHNRGNAQRRRAGCRAPRSPNRPPSTPSSQEFLHRYMSAAPSSFLDHQQFARFVNRPSRVAGIERHQVDRIESRHQWINLADPAGLLRDQNAVCSRLDPRIADRARHQGFVIGVGWVNVGEIARRRLQIVSRAADCSRMAMRS